MKAFTDVVQSKKLAEILPIESADMSWAGTGLGKPFARTIPCKGYPEEICPCWSLVALLSVFSLPRLMLDEQEDGERGWLVSHYTDDTRYDSYYRDEPIDACYNLILKLHEQKLL